ncbi:hypothetical protein XYCOK13_10960 [Xylanibacillus composti]|uniref:N-acetyltransferase domain-containing protein n=2 Tax=Xylanibacillus composti TaxID=1572762 RepID=A0A8J4M1W2_9BACL|nr:hypothetical protein XYCOK13_10960 [Xylanibacillus composti]
MRLMEDYKHTDRYRDSFNRLAHQTFGISFEEWYQRGYWDERYICYSYVDRDEVVANVSVSRLQLRSESACLKACQIGTVMTHPEYRGRGLSAKLMDHVIQKHEPEADVFFLFANRQVLDYYPRFGFSPVQESRFVWNRDGECSGLRGAAPPTWRQLDLQHPQDERRLLHALKSRQPISDRLSVLEHEGIFMWHALEVFPTGLYYHEQTGQIWACSHHEGTLHLYDCISPSSGHGRSDHGSFPELFDELCVLLPGTRRVEFAFTPDKLGLPVYNEPLRGNDVLYAKQSRTSGPAFPEDGPFKYPITAQA